jgi:hypothetical protein
MILILCSKCALAIRVMGDADEIRPLVGDRSEFWPDKYICPRCEERAVGCHELEASAADVERLRPRDLTPQEALAAFHGLGLPDEQLCNKALLESLLRQQPIRHIAARDIEGSRRCYLHHIELWDGTKIYLGAGSDGAVVYRIAHPHSYTEQVSHELGAG